MDKIKEILNNETLEEKSLAAVEINTYFRLYNKVTFLSKEKNGHPTLEFVPVKSQEFLEQQFYIASALLEFGVEKGDKVAIYASNSVRYAVEIYAILSIGAVFVPLYPTITEEEAEYLIKHSETLIVFVGDVPQYQKGLSIMKKVKSPIRKLIANYQVDKKEENVISYNDLIKTGMKTDRINEIISIVKSIQEDEIAALIYTAGTTGSPKGVLLSHKNFMSQRCLIDIFKISGKDTRVAHLPFSHVFGLSADLFLSAYAGTVTCITKTFETEEILKFINEVKPTILCSVPRMYEKLCINVLETINQYKIFKRLSYTFAIQIGREIYIRKKSGKLISPLLRLLKLLYFPILRKLRQMLSLHKSRLLFCGGGPLPLEVAYFFNGIGLPLREGYGLTETSPTINVNRPGGSKAGTLGPPVPGAIEKIADDGEILVKGPMVCKGYYKNPEEEELAFTLDGFFKTGDIGLFDDNGNLIITGRIKDLIITSAGKNIAPLRIEKRFENEPFINYICVVGDGRKYITALVVPEFQLLRKYAKDNNIKFNTDNDLIENPEIINFYKHKINQVSDTLAKYEQIKKFTLMANDFSVQGGELSPTFKFRRQNVHEKYKDIIDKMYPSSDTIADEM